MKIIVLDTNCLLVSLPTLSPYHRIWTDILEGKIVLCVSTDILYEYEEVLSFKMTPQIAKSIIRLIIALPNLRLVKPTYYLHLIESDPDDNKFVDCAFCGGAELIVSNDSHFNSLKQLSFPKFSVVTIQEFMKLPISE